jgi:hypothetical protein
MRKSEGASQPSGFVEKAKLKKESITNIKI